MALCRRGWGYSSRAARGGSCGRPGRRVWMASGVGRGVCCPGSAGAVAGRGARMSLPGLLPGRCAPVSDRGALSTACRIGAPAGSARPACFRALCACFRSVGLLSTACRIVCACCRGLDRGGGAAVDRGGRRGRGVVHQVHQVQPVRVRLLCLLPGPGCVLRSAWAACGAAWRRRGVWIMSAAVLLLSRVLSGSCSCSGLFPNCIAGIREGWRGIARR